MALTAEQKALLNNFTGWAAFKARLGDMLDDALAVATGDIADLAVTTGKINDLAVTTGKINDLAVTTGKLAADAVDGTKLADDAVSLEHLDAGVTPGLMVVAAGEFTTVGGDANESIVSASVLGTDTVVAFIRKAGATPRTLDTITPGAGSIALVFSGDPSNDHIVGWFAMRAPA